MKPTGIKKAFLQIGLLLLLFGILITCYLLILQFFELPFRATNDMLHQNESVMVLDFLIPGGTYIEEKFTIGDVVRLRYGENASLYENSFKKITELIPNRYRYTADLALFLFWSLMYMIFFRVVTFIGYGRALRISLLLGACTYYFMPDFSSGNMDDFFFLSVPVLIIAIRYCIHARRKHPRNGKDMVI